MAKSKTKGVEKSLAEDVLDSFDDFFKSVETGKVISVKTVRLDLTVDEFTAGEIRGVRTALGVSQALFAGLLTVSPATVRAWEQGRRFPPAIARRLLSEMRDNPVRWQNMLSDAMRSQSVG